MMTSVFNQLMPAMLCFVILDNKKSAYIWLFNCTYFVGIAISGIGSVYYHVLDYIVNIAKGKKILFKEIFSFYNIYAILWLVVVCLFYFGNSMVGIIFYKYWLKYDNILKFLAAL